MSFVKKAAKKVFKGIKKVVKKVWKPVLIGSAILLTAGMAAPGFAGLTMGQGLGAFLGSVGSTMAAGAGAIAGTLGLSSAPGLFSPGAFGGLIGGAATSAAPAAGVSGMLSGGTAFNAAGTALAQQAAGMGAALGASGAGALGASALSGVASTAGGASTGFFGGMMNALRGMVSGGSAPAGGGGGLFSGPMGKMMLFNGISQGIQGYAASKEADRARKKDKRRNFFGGPMRGGTPEFESGFPTFSAEQVQPPAQQTMQAQQEAFANNAPSHNLFQTQQPQQLQGQVQPMAPIMQPGNLDLIGPDPQNQQNFGVA